MTLCLLDMTGKQKFELKPGKNIVGRDESCDIFIDQRLLSRKHAVIGVAQGQVAIRDLQSTNGTLVNFKVIQGAHPLKVGDTVTFGEFTFRLANAGVPLRETMLGRYQTPDQSFSISDPGGDQTALKEVMSLPPGWEPAIQSCTPDTGSVDEGFARLLQRDDLDLAHCAAVLAVVDGEQVMPLKQGRRVWSLGRGEQCDVVLDHNTISLSHAEIQRTDNGWSLRDLESKNGCKVNGVRAKKMTLAHGVTVELGQLKCVFFDLSKAATFV